ncbi:MAG TPA: hypothetical protein VF548_02905 [Allosphingosinicella sp.]
MSGGVTLAHALFAAALFEVVAVLAMARAVRRSDPAGAAERSRGRAVILGASIVSASSLCLVALFLPAAQMRIL